MTMHIMSQTLTNVRQMIGRYAWRLSLSLVRVAPVLTLLLSGALVGSGSWMLCHPSVTPFFVPGATDIHVVSTGVWEWQIAYAAPGPAYAWYITLSRTLAAQQWNDRTLWRPDGSSMFDPVTPLRFERGYAGVLWDEVVLTPDHRAPQRATITLRRRIRIPWWPSWSPAAYHGAAIAGRTLNPTLPRR
jgi:hypothetical protein